MRTQIAINIDADPRVVFDLARDISRWPALLPHYRRVTVHSHVEGHRTATMAAWRPLGRFGIPVSWRTEQWSDESDPDDLRLRFSHIGGATRGMNVTWHIRRTSTGTRVTIEHEFSRRVPLLGDRLFPRFVDHVFVRPIAGRTLAMFKQLAEAPGYSSGEH